MTKLGAKHVEWNCAFDTLIITNEVESRLFIDELFDEPCGRETVDMDIATRHPPLLLKLGFIQSSGSNFRARSRSWCLSSANDPFTLSVGIERSGSSWCAKEVVINNALQFSVHFIEFGLVFCQPVR